MFELKMLLFLPGTLIVAAALFRALRLRMGLLGGPGRRQCAYVMSILRGLDLPVERFGTTDIHAVTKQLDHHGGLFARLAAEAVRLPESTVRDYRAAQDALEQAIDDLVTDLDGAASDMLTLVSKLAQMGGLALMLVATMVALGTSAQGSDANALTASLARAFLPTLTGLVLAMAAIAVRAMLERVLRRAEAALDEVAGRVLAARTAVASHVSPGPPAHGDVHRPVAKANAMNGVNHA